jgi:hypothetical protein
VSYLLFAVCMSGEKVCKRGLFDGPKIPRLRATDYGHERQFRGPTCPLSVKKEEKKKET